MPNKYPPLLPAPALPHPTPASSNNPGTLDEPSKRKRVGVQVACNTCRTKKTRCDGDRPCAQCVKRNTECVYTDKRETNQESVEIVELLKTTPEGTAFDILRLLRASGDPTAVLSTVKEGMDGKVFPSGLEAARTMVLPRPSSLEFELMSKNYISYPVLQPVTDLDLEQRNLLRPVGLDQEIPDGQGKLGAEALRNNNDSAGQPFPERTSFESISSQEAGLCDERLYYLDVTFWTTVPVRSNTAARAISLYLETDHPLLGTFDPDLFVADLISQQRVFCSSFLVNAVLYWAFQMYSAIDNDAITHIAQFSAEAERQWEYEKTSDSPLNMAAAQLLSLAYMGDGRDHHVLHYLSEALAMGMRMGFLGVDSQTAGTKLENMSEVAVRGASFAAWGIFNWAVLVSLFYRQPGTQCPEFPPTLPIPGDYEEEDPGTFAPTSMVANLPPYMGNTLPALCKFWSITQSVSLVYSSDTPKMERGSLKLEFAEMKYRELLAWSETLPTELIRHEENPHHVVVFHMWFHAAILDIFRPFLTRQLSEKLSLKTFTTRRSTPVAAYWASVSQLKNLVVQYRSNYEESTYTILWQPALMYVTNAILHDTNDPQWRLYLLFCMYSYEVLRKSFRMSEVIGRGLLTMALRDRVITSVDARGIMRQLQGPGMDAIRATFMGDLELAETDPKSASVETLAGDFENVALFREFVNETPEN